MLTVTRNEGEKIILILEDGRRVTVQLVRIKSSHAAKIGIEADRSIRIVRDDVLLADEGATNG